MKIYTPAPGLIVEIPYGVSFIKGKKQKSRGVVYDGVIDVVCGQDGKVVKISFNDNPLWGMGHSVLVKHSDDLYTFYAHGAHAPSFSVGDMLITGEHIFKSGQTGKATRPQLYFEVRTGRLPHKHADPYSYITRFGFMPGVVPPEQQKLKVTGKMDRKTWKALQEALKANRTWNFVGLADGIPREDTWLALKESASIFYTSIEKSLDKTGIIKAIQRKLYAGGFMEDHESGVLDSKTVSTLQRLLNSGEYC
jgi:murein DD-endopeptidase MepM/ murein hydrolase activator NlpD